MKFVNLNLEYHKNDDSDKNIALLLNEVRLEDISYTTNGVDLIIIDSILSGYNLKFHGKENAFSSASRLSLNNVVLENETSLEILGSEASFDGVRANGLRQNKAIVDAKENSYIVLKNSIFINNTVFENGTAALAFVNSSVLVTNCTFKCNSGKNGGAIIASHGTKLNISFCKFDSNSATDKGGALYAVFQVDANITNSLFFNNKATVFGGAIFSSNRTTFVLVSTNFTRNMAQIDSGGSIATIEMGHYYIDKCNFTENSAGRQGGVIYCSDTNSFEIKNSHFDSNVAELKTAVLQVWRRAHVDIKNCTFTNNKALFSRSVIATYSKVTLIIQGCLFENNTSQFTGVLEGRENIEVHISDSIFVANAAVETGLIYIGVGSIFTLHSCLFSQNVGSSVVYAKDYAFLNFTNCTFSNHLLEGQPVITLSQAELTIQNSSFSNNTQITAGGVFITKFQSTLRISSSQFTENHALRGGVFYMVFSSRLIVEKSTFVNNSANNGGVAYLQDSNATIISSSFTNNTSEAYGGVATALTSLITIRNSTFSSNKAVYGGCFFVHNGSSLDVYNSVLENGHAREGGVIYKNGGGHVSLESCILRNNLGKYGGAIYFFNSNYLRLSRGYCQYKQHLNINCLQFRCETSFLRKCTLYTSAYNISNGNETISSTSNENFYTEATRFGMIYIEKVGYTAWLETPYASCKTL